MKIAQAKQKLMDIAQGQYHSIKYEISDHSNGDVSQTCEIYIHGKGTFRAPHWENCFQQLEESQTDKPAISEDLPVSAKTTEETA